eukprot:6178662-Pleurochrysis_carterae.AAC.4
MFMRRRFKPSRSKRHAPMQLEAASLPTQYRARQAARSHLSAPWSLSPPPTFLVMLLTSDTHKYFTRAAEHLAGAIR